MHMPLFLLAIPVLSTLAGGLLTLRFERYRPILIAASAGLLLGAAFLDLLPEAISLAATTGSDVTNVLSLTLLFFLGFSLLESALDAWSESREQHGSPRRAIGRVAGGMLIFHSFRDGMAIGAAFAASHVAGYAVAMGIATHDFGDGMNTVILTTGGEKAGRSDYVFLALDALAPFFGGLLTVWWLLSSRNAILLLTLAAGFFLQMATSDFLPQLRLKTARRRGLILVVAGGAALIFVTNRLLGWK